MKDRRGQHHDEYFEFFHNGVAEGAIFGGYDTALMVN
jgi:hypothetical protein